MPIPVFYLVRCVMSVYGCLAGGQLPGYVPLQWANDLPQMLALTADRVVGVDDKVALAWRGSSDEEQQRGMILKLIKNNRYQKMSPSCIRGFIHPSLVVAGKVACSMLAMEQVLGAQVLTKQGTVVKYLEQADALSKKSPITGDTLDQVEALRQQASGLEQRFITLLIGTLVQEFMHQQGENHGR